MCVNGRRVSCLMSHLVGGKAYATFSSDGDIKVSAPLPRKPWLWCCPRFGETSKSYGCGNRSVPQKHHWLVLQNDGLVYVRGPRQGKRDRQVRDHGQRKPTAHAVTSS